MPYTIKVETKDGDKRVETIVERRAVFAPEQLEIAADSTSQVLHRGLYDVNVYTAKVAVSGRFGKPDISLVVADPQTVRWNDAVLVLGLSDVSGLKEAASVKIDGTQDIAFAPSIGIAGVEANGIHARLIDRTPTAPGTTEAPLQAFTFQTALTFTGSGQLSFAPAARETSVAMNSDWPSPSFSGAFLPAERSVTDRSFTATWRIPHLARSVPQAWVLNDQGLERLHPHMFGVSFYQPVDFYDLVNRSVKYSVLFLAAAFMAVFLLETQSAKRVHWVQYLFTGVALTFFYVLLLSLAEHIGFGWSYLHRLRRDRRHAGRVRLPRASQHQGRPRHGRRILTAVRDTLFDPAPGRLRAAHRRDPRLRRPHGRHVRNAPRRLGRPQSSQQRLPVREPAAGVPAVSNLGRNSDCMVGQNLTVEISHGT